MDGYLKLGEARSSGSGRLNVTCAGKHRRNGGQSVPRPYSSQRSVTGILDKINLNTLSHFNFAWYFMETDKMIVEVSWCHCKYILCIV